MDRFYHPDLSTPAFSLLEGEAHHLGRVLRKAKGDLVELFDGEGNSAPARVMEVTRRTVQVELAGPVLSEPQRPVRTRVACAVPKGERFRWLIEKLTEVGTDDLLLLFTERSVVEPGDARRERLEQHVLSACKQCGRNRALKIHPPVEWEIFLKEATGPWFLADRGGDLAASVPVPQDATLSSLTMAVGPEGGWSPAEREGALAAHGQPVAFGRHILRVETAALIGGSWLEGLRERANETEASVGR